MLQNLKIYLVTLLILAFSCSNKVEKKNNSDNPINIKLKSTEDMLKIIENTKWFGQSCVRIIFEGKTIYFDPYNISKVDKADIIFITHSHKDHFSPENIRKIITPNTKIYAPLSTSMLLSDSGFVNVTAVKPFENFEIEGIKVSSVPAYNVVKTNFHSKENNWLGYIVNLGGTNVYHPGDTERIPEMKNFKTDIAFMPLGQTYTMNNVEEAVEAVIDVKAKIAIPFHYGMYEGKVDDAEKFKELLNGKVEVIILKRE
jgi:L-ascorbate metabolism protein UlaG (beta-lactamase superfamily)